jgi:hypothetical protein
MPQPPDLSGAPAAPASQAPVTLNRRLEALGIRRAPIGTPSDVVEPEAADEPEPEIDDGSGGETWDVATDTDGDSAAAPAEVDSTPKAATATATGVLAERLAQLDERLSGAAATPSAPASDEAGAESSTAIVVKGLGSFGAITSFKQALERVEGIRGVTLSLGPTGEFVYRASHMAGFDLVAAIRSVEGQNVEIEQEDGALRVTVSRSR